MNYEYYEVIACEFFGIEPRELFLKTRKGEIKNARFFCMTYRHVNLGFSFRISGLRYNLDHSTSIHAKKTIDNWIETKDDFGKMYLEFLEKCRAKRQQVELLLQQQKIQLLRTIETMGWFDFVSSIEQPFCALIEFVYRNDNEDNIREHINICEAKLSYLKYLYQLEDEPQL
jgi:hypothetical protein